MNKYFKKFSIMFIIALAFMGIGMINNESVANAATVGQQLTSPENGWERFDDNDKNFIYSNYNGKSQWSLEYYDYYKNGSRHGTNNTTKNTAYINFKFFGSKIRIISTYSVYGNDKLNIIIDGKKESFTQYKKSSKNSLYVLYESELLNEGIHNVEIEIPYEKDRYFAMDCVDIYKNGKLIPYDINLNLNKSTMDLTEGDSGQLTATTTPAAVGVTWKVSDPSIATIEVDPTNGKIIKVTALKEGTCTITATTADGNNLSASCTINVTKKDEPKPDNPTDSGNKTGALLIINLTDGETKVFDVSSSEVAKFKEWYNTKSEYENKLTYEFDKTVNSNISVEENVVHEKITSYEIRKY